MQQAIKLEMNLIWKHVLLLEVLALYIIHGCEDGCNCDKTLSSYNCTGIRLKSFPSIPSTTQILHLQRNELNILDELPKLMQLKTLNFIDNKLSSIQVHLQDITPALTTLDLSFNLLESIPSDLPSSLIILKLKFNRLSTFSRTELLNVPNLQELFLDGNQITALNVDISTVTPALPTLSGLEKLSISKNKINHIDNDFFHGMEQMQALSLSQNTISVLHNVQFKGLKRLKLLDLSNNLLKHIYKKLFKDAPSVKYLYLNHNQLEEFPFNLPFLEWLDISHNNIRIINESLTRNEVLPIEMLNIAFNPLHCDCHLLWVKEIWDTRQYLLDYSDVIDENKFLPSCASPQHLSGETWDNVANEMFRCENHSKKHDTDQQEGDKIKLDQLTDDQTQIFYDDNEDSYDVIKKFQEKQAQVTQDIKSDEIKLSIVEISTNKITLKWHDNPNQEKSNFFLRYHIFGNKAETTLYVEVIADKTSHTLSHLQPNTAYIICIVSSLQVTEANINANQCIETKTALDENSPFYFLQNEIFLNYLKVFILCFLASVVIVGMLVFLSEIVRMIVIMLKPKDHED